MKQIIFSCALIAAFTSAHAQVSQDEYYGENITKEKLAYKAPAADNEYANTEMSVHNGTITFSDLPELGKPTWAIITNGAGEQLKQMRVSKDKNEMDIHHLQRGMYFVTLIYKNKSKKAFVLEIEQ